jgi:hypothetical protein
VYLNDNNLRGRIPDNYGNADNLRDFYVNGNELQGEIPSIQPGQLASLNEFLLQDNDLTGIMPSSICALRTPAGMLEDLWADCEVIDGQAEVLCECCTQCVFA